MSFNTISLVARLCVVGTIFSACTVTAAEPERLPESNLSRGLFQQAIFNRDETRLLTATANLAQLWDLTTGGMLQQFEGHAAPIYSICFSPDERMILTAGGRTTEHGRDDSTLRFWDISTGASVAVLTTVGKDLVDEIGQSTSYHVPTARYSPNGRQVLAVMTSRNSFPDAAVLWNVDKQDIDLVLPRISTTSGTIVIREPVQFSPDGKSLLGLWNEASQVVVWDAGTGVARWRFSASDCSDRNDEHRRYEIAQWSPSGKLVLAVSNDWTVRIWDVSTGREIQRLKGHDDRISAARFFANETQIFTASGDGTVRLWDRQSGEQLRQWDYSGPVQELSVSQDGQRLLTRTLQRDPSLFRNRWLGELRELKSGESIRTWELPPLWIAENQPLNAYRLSVMSPSGRLVLTTVWTDGEVKVTLVDAETGAIKQTY